MKRLGILSLWGLALSSVFAQEPPPQQAPPQQPPAEEEKPPPNLPKFVLGWGSWGLTGNRTTFNRYASMNRGFFIKELSYGIHEASPGQFGEFTFRGWPSEDNVLETQVIFGPKATSFEGSFQRHQFYRPSIFLIDRSSRRTAEAIVRQPINPRLNLELDFEDSQLDKVREAPLNPIRTRTDRFTGRLAGEIGSGRAEVSFTNRQYFDRMNLQPDTRAQTWSGSYLQPFGALNLEGRFAETRFEQSGLSSSRLQNLALDGDLALGRDVSLQFGLQSSKYRLPETLNAYVRERATTWARVFGFWSGMSGQLSWKHTETERVRADHTFVDVPKFNTFEGKLSGRFGGGPRWALKGKWQNLDGDAIMLTDDPRRLYWDDKADFQFKLDHGGELWTAYAALSHRFFQNELRDIDIRSNNFVAGGSWQIKPQVEAFGELMFDNADTQFTEPGGLIGLDSFFPSSRLVTIGVNWVIDPDTTLSTSYSDLVTDNDNPNFDPEGNVSFRFFSANLQHRTKFGNRLGLLIAPGKYSDRVIRQMGYNSTVVLVTAEWRY